MFKKAIIAAAVLASVYSGQAFATETANIKVIGAITPGTCSFSLAGGGEVDFRRTPNATVLTYSPGVGVGSLADPNTIRLAVTVLCAAEVQVALGITDNKAGTKFMTTDPSDTHGFGMGVDTLSNNIGQYRIAFDELKMSNDTITTLGAADSVVVSSTAVGASFTTPTGLDGTNFKHNAFVGFKLSPLAGTTPQKVKQIGGDLKFTAQYNQNAVAANVGTTMEFDGSTTLSLNYL